jgi:hypothetical protein
VVVGLDILHLQVVLVVLLSGDGAAAVADLAEGVVEVAAVETDPISAGVDLGSMFAVGFLHRRKINII